MIKFKQTLEKKAVILKMLKKGEGDVKHLE
jgi:hypothetical protein